MTNIFIFILEIYAIGIFLVGYFNSVHQFHTANNIMSSNDQPMKVILILTDAFRIDFFANDDFSFYQQMKKEHSKYQALYYGIATAPTATQLNLETMMTGNFPSFIHFSTNMAANSVFQDNLIDSMIRNNKTLALLGDDTWNSMFPTQFHYKYVSQSFDVRDLDSDDDIVSNNIFKLINNYDFIVGHLLGIDHSGHSFNDSNTAIKQKQQQYSKLFLEIYNKMDENTMLLIIGDHGMSSDGNHGGDSIKEISTTIYAINKKYKFKKNTFKNNNNILNITYLETQPLIDRSEYIRQSYSINICPTIAYLMGISIPYSNIGSVLLELINPKLNTTNVCKENLMQIQTYLQQLSNHDFSLKRLTLEAINGDSCSQIQGIIQQLQINIKQDFKSYDYNLLYFGLSLMLLLFIFHFLSICGQTFNKSFAHSKNYLIYKYELPLTIILIIITSNFLNGLYLILKMLSIYFIMLLITQLLLPLLNKQNCLQIYYDLTQTTHNERRYFLIIVNAIIQKGIEVLSLTRQILLSVNTFGIIWNILITLTISQLKLLRGYKSLIVSLLILLIVEQYNMSTSPISPLQFSILQNVFNNALIQFILPLILLQFFLYKVLKNKLFNIMLGISQFLHLFNNYETITQIINLLLKNQIYFITIYLPIIIYITTILLIVIEQKSYYLFCIILITSGKNGMIVYNFLFYIIYFLFQYVQDIKQKWIPLIFGSILQNLFGFFWVILGHYKKFSSVKFKDALIGFQSYDVVFNTILLIISIYGIFGTISIIKYILKYQIEKKENSIDDKSYQNLFINSLILMQFVQVSFAILHTSMNLYHQNIVEEFAERIIYESIFFILLIAFQLLDEGLHYIKEKVMLRKMYQILSDQQENTKSINIELEQISQSL